MQPGLRRCCILCEMSDWEPSYIDMFKEGLMLWLDKSRKIELNWPDLVCDLYRWDKLRKSVKIN